MKRFDVLMIGAGHNGLVAATLLGRAGIKVGVLERASVIGGATRTEYPFPKAPNLGQSTGAYLLGLMPPEIATKLDIKFPVLRRDPHYFLPTTDDRYLMFGADQEAMREQFLSFFSEQDWDANQRLQSEIAKLRDDIAPAWLQAPDSLEESASRFIRPELQQTFIDLCRGSVGEYLERFEFKSDLIKAMYAVTDGFSGSTATWDTPGSGHNFLVHNMCRLPGADGTWMVIEGGMGTVVSKLAAAAIDAGAEILTDSEVANLTHANGGVVVSTTDGREFSAKAAMANADPFRTRNLVGRDAYPDDFNTHLDSMKRNGSTMKVNLALRELPTFSCLPENRGQHQATIHILPEENVVMESLTSTFAAVQRGELPEFPTIEWYIHTTIDPSLSDEAGRHSSALFVQWVPHQPKGSSWEVEAEKYAWHLLSLADRFAPGTSDLVDDMSVLTPQSIEENLGSPVDTFTISIIFFHSVIVTHTALLLMACTPVVRAAIPRAV